GTNAHGSCREQCVSRGWGPHVAEPPGPSPSGLSAGGARMFMGHDAAAAPDTARAPLHEVTSFEDFFETRRWPRRESPGHPCRRRGLERGSWETDSFRRI